MKGLASKSPEARMDSVDARAGHGVRRLTAVGHVRQVVSPRGVAVDDRLAREGERKKGGDRRARRTTLCTGSGGASEHAAGRVTRRRAHESRGGRDTFWRGRRIQWCANAGSSRQCKHQKSQRIVSVLRHLVSSRGEGIVQGRCSTVSGSVLQRSRRKADVTRRAGRAEKLCSS